MSVCGCNQTTSKPTQTPFAIILIFGIKSILALWIRVPAATTDG